MAGLYEDDRESDAIPFFREGWAMREAVGDCIHSWCTLEKALVSVLSWALNTPEHKAGIVFSTVHGFAVKLDFINELMEDELEDRPELEFWRSMVGNLRTLATARNVLAHHSPITRIGETCAHPSHWKTVISPNAHDPRRRIEKRRGFTLVDTQFLAADIKRHERLLGEFVCHLDETKLNARVYCKAEKKVKLYDELKGTSAPKPKKRKKTRTRAKVKPPIEFDSTWSAEGTKRPVSSFI